MVDLSKLKKHAQEYTIMCVDDNQKLRQHLEKFLKKFFKSVIVAEDAKTGIEKYIEYRPHIVITDIEMPEMNGLEMSKQLKQINKDVPIIIMSAYDEKEYLLDSIRYGVVNYLKKPAQSTELAEALFETLDSVKKDESKDIFVNYLQHAFDYQHNMIILMEGNKPIIANPIMLDYFNVKSIEEFNEKHTDIGKYFLEHPNFLFSTDQQSWFDKVRVTPNVHFHVKMKDNQKNPDLHHFLLHYQDIPEKKNYGLLLLNDITDLNLLPFFEKMESNKDEIFEDKEAMKSSLQMIVENNVDIQIHNFYKGLRITNKASIVEVDEKTLILKSSPHQLRASEYENFMIISSKALPHFIMCKEIMAVNYEKKVIVAASPSFMSTSPTQRKNIRVVPKENYDVSYFFEKNTYDKSITISDISVDAVKLKLIAKPVHLHVDSNIELNIAFRLDEKTRINLKTTGKVIREHSHADFYHMVVSYDLESSQKHKLVDMIAKRQMELIREFKTL